MLLSLLLLLFSSPRVTSISLPGCSVPPPPPRETTMANPRLLRCSSRDSPAAAALSAAQPMLIVFLLLAFIMKKFGKKRRCYRQLLAAMPAGMSALTSRRWLFTRVASPATPRFIRDHPMAFERAERKGLSVIARMIFIQPEPEGYFQYPVI